MVKTSKVVALIPARKNSKRLPFKNKKLLKGKPLISYTIEIALECDFIDDILVFSDDIDILNIAKEYNVISKEEIGFEGKKPWEVVKEAMEYYPMDTILIFLQPTTPLRTSEELKEAFELYLKTRNHIVPGYIDYEKNAIFTNGLVFINTVENLLKYRHFYHNHPIIFLSPRERSIDIDTIEDFKEAERLMKNEK